MATPSAPAKRTRRRETERLDRILSVKPARIPGMKAIVIVRASGIRPKQIPNAIHHPFFEKRSDFTAASSVRMRIAVAGIAKWKLREYITINGVVAVRAAALKPA